MKLSSFRYSIGVEEHDEGSFGCVLHQFDDDFQVGFHGLGLCFKSTLSLSSSARCTLLGAQA